MQQSLSPPPRSKSDLHFSVKEFLVSDFIQTSACSDFLLEDTLVHSFLAKSCLVYLLHVRVPVDVDNVGSFPLVKYAAKFWVRHSDASDEAWDSPLLREMTECPTPFWDKSKWTENNLDVLFERMAMCVYEQYRFESMPDDLGRRA